MAHFEPCPVFSTGVVGSLKKRKEDKGLRC